MDDCYYYIHCIADIYAQRLFEVYSILAEYQVSKLNNSYSAVFLTLLKLHLQQMKKNISENICCVSLFLTKLVLLELAISELQNMLCAYISAIQCTCIVFTCDVCKYICGTIVYLSKANRFLFFWAGSCFASPGAGIPQGRGKV